nr:DUF5079 family protein [Staphylococcus aureus]
MTLNVITGYSMPLFIASTYVVGAAVNDIDVFYYWCGVALMLFISWLGLFYFIKMNLIVKILILQLTP